MIELPTLYGYDSSGKIKSWKVWTEGDKVFTATGKLDGKKTERSSTSKPKNLGKSNETTAEEQALKDAKSKWDKKKKEGYGEDIDNIPVVRLPMRGYEYEKYSKSVKGMEASVEPKLDGVRATMTLVDGEVILTSRGGEEYPIPDHIKGDAIKAFETLEKNYGSPYTLDGELYRHGEEFESINGAARCPEDYDFDLEFHCFDVCVEGYDYSVRRSFLQDVDNLNLDFIKVVPCHYLKEISDESVKHMHDLFVLEGYEGAMVKVLPMPYRYGYKSNKMLKVKTFMDSEFEVVDVEDDKEGRAILVLVMQDGEKFKCTYGSHEEREYQLKNPSEFIGKHLNVQYQGLTKYRKPRFPTGKYFREGEFVDGEFFPKH